MNRLARIAGHSPPVVLALILAGCESNPPPGEDREILLTYRNGSTEQIHCATWWTVDERVLYIVRCNGERVGIPLNALSRYNVWRPEKERPEGGVPQTD